MRYFAFALAVLVFGCVPPTQESETSDGILQNVPSPADLVVRGGAVITVDPQLGNQSAVAVRDAVIVAVGSEAEIKLYIGPDTEVVELNGRVLIPGFIEGHGHFLSLGRAQQVLDLSQAQIYSDIVGQVAAAADAAPAGAWIFGMGWHQDKWDRQEPGSVDGVPLNTALNEAAPDNPVYLSHASGHAAFANDSALQAAGIDDESRDPAGGTIVRTAQGVATGLLREKAKSLLEVAIAEYESRRTPEQVQADLRERVQLAGAQALANGITSFHDAGASFAHIDFFQALEDAGELPVRLYVMVRGETNEAMQERLSGYLSPANGNDFLAVRSIKRQIDGALGAHGAWLLEPYVDLSESSGLVLESIEEIEETAHLAIKYGFQVNTHAIGTRANRETLDLYERVWAEHDIAGDQLRWRIEHAQHIHPQDILRFGQLGVIAALQGVHCTSDGPWIASRLGEPRTEQTSYRWRDLLDSGARIGNGTDVPVENINPIASYYASVARMMNTGEAFYADQAMTPMEALKSYTLDNAYAAFEESLKGSITPGKLADFVVLSQNILQVPAADIPNTQVDRTIVGGETRYLRTP